jgi:hypothetical protein
MKTVTSLRAALLACALVSFAPLAAQAATILETATAEAGDPGDYIATDFNQRVLGATFTLADRTHISSIGFGAGRFGSGTIFGAIVPVDPVTGFPLASFDDLAPTALGSTLITVPSAAGDATGLLSLDLAPGTYGVVFGSGQFGASGVGPFTESDAIGDPRMFDSFFGSAFEDFASDDVRLFVNGEVPEPASVALMLAGLVGLGWLVTRRRRSLPAATA